MTTLQRAATPLVALLAFFAQSLHADDWDEPSLGFSGVSISENAEAFAKWGKMPVKKGLLVTDVSPGSAAGKSGLKPMQIIAQINGTTVDSTTEASELVKSLPIGSKLAISGWWLTPKNTWQRGKISGEVISRRDAILGSITKERDEVSGRTTYRHVLEPDVLESSDVNLSVTTSDDKTHFLHVRVDYVGERLLAPSKLLLVRGDDRRSLDLRYGGTDTQIGKKLRVNEWASIVADDPKELDAVKMLVFSSTKVRIEGAQYFTDVEYGFPSAGRAKTMYMLHRMLSGKQLED